MLTRRPPITEVRDPPEFSATVTGVGLTEHSVTRYASVCGFGSGVPATYPHVLAMPLHLEIFALPDFPLRPMGLIHLSNVIECLAPLRNGMQLDVTVSARNYQRTDAGLAFDMATEMTSEGRSVWDGLLNSLPRSLRSSLSFLSSSTILNIWKKNSRRFQVTNMIVWGIAYIPALMLFLLQAFREQVVHFLYLLWGPWVYVVFSGSVF